MGTSNSIVASRSTHSTADIQRDASQIDEVTQTGSPQTVWQMNITGENAYRGYRIPSLYPGVTWQQ